ncbi:MAG TPA: hypothetical protein VGU20_13990 [Stellaceae bacterium]|nr:hypothetical protein [Stellaceae bacterium]
MTAAISYSAYSRRKLDEIVDTIMRMYLFAQSGSEMESTAVTVLCGLGCAGGIADGWKEELPPDDPNWTPPGEIAASLNDAHEAVCRLIALRGSPPEHDPRAVAKLLEDVAVKYARKHATDLGVQIVVRDLSRRARERQERAGAIVTHHDLPPLAPLVGFRVIENPAFAGEPYERTPRSRDEVECALMQLRVFDGGETA